MRLLSILTICLFAAVLVGCGGGGGGGGGSVNIPDTTGPQFQSLSATYSYASGDATIYATLSDVSGVSSARAYVNGSSSGILFTLVSANTYRAIYENVPDNYSEQDVVYTVVVYATDTKGNVSTSQTTFTVPTVMPPPPPPIAG